MKKYILSISLFTCASIIYSQPNKIWSKIYGGNNSDVCSIISQYNDTMIIAAGKSASTNIGGNKGSEDFMVCQFKPNGDLIRIKTFGGPLSDQISTYIPLANGNLLLGGFTSGKGGDVSNLYGLIDIWLVAYNPTTGAKIWEKSIGGTNNDQLYDLFYLEAGRIFLTGHTKSLDKDVVGSPTKGGNDVLITSIDESGSLVKVSTFGGTKDESAKKILRSDAFGGQMLVLGESESNDLDFNGLSRGKKDIFILKINRNINKIFLTTIGGPGDDIFADAVNLGDNGMIVFSTVSMSGGQVDSLRGAKDIWMSKLDKNGILVWSKIIGGKNDESAVKAILDPDGNILFLGNSNSKDQDIKANYGGSDVLLMKLDTSGNILWQKNYGGTGGDNANAICLGLDHTMYMVSQSFSTNNDLPSTNINAPDFWTLKLFECGLIESNYTTSSCLGDTLTVNGIKFYEGKDTGTTIIKNATINGCDSIVHVTVEFKSAIESNFSTSICAGDTISILGAKLYQGKESETVRLPNASVNGCDSIVHITITLKPTSVGQITDSLCYNDSIRINGVLFNRLNPIQTFKFINQFGCDSFLLVDLQFDSEIVLKDTILTKDDGTGIGCIKIVMQGGCLPYTYKWNNGATTEENCNLKSGNYSVEVRDCLGCPQFYSFKLGSTVGTQTESETFYSLSELNDKILITLPGNEWVQYHLFNSEGKSLLSGNSNQKLLEISKKVLPVGVIYIKLSSKTGKNKQFRFMN